MNAKEVFRLLLEVGRHAKKTKIVVEHDGKGDFVVSFEKLQLSTEEYMMLSDRRSGEGTT